jgi:hypothetical protein
MEERPGDLLQDHRLQAAEVEETKLQRLRHRGQEGCLRISPPEGEQSAQRPHPAAMRLFDERRDVRIEHGVVALQQRRLGRWRAESALRCRVVSGQLLLRIADTDQARVHRDDLVARADPKFARIQIHRQPLPHPAFGNRVAIGLDRHEAVQIDHPLGHLIDRRQHCRQRLQAPFLDRVGRARRHPEDALRLGIRHRLAPSPRLLVQVGEIGERPAGQEMAFDPGKGSFDAPLAVGLVDRVGAEGESQRARERHHLRRKHRVVAGAVDDDHARVVDDASRAATGQEAHRLEQELLGFKAREARVVPDEQTARVRQDQGRALCRQRLAGEGHAVRRGIVLHLLAGRKDILARALGRGAQAGFPDPAGERAVAGIEAQFRLQHLL